MRLVRITSVLALAGVAAWSALPGGGPAAAQTPEPGAATAVTRSGAVTAATGPGAVKGPAFAAKARSVTLITGDTVRVSSVNGQTAIDVDPAAGREKVPFVSSSAGGDV